MFSIAELWVLMIREHGAGSSFEIDYVRGGEHLHGVGALSGGRSTAATNN